MPWWCAGRVGSAVVGASLFLSTSGGAARVQNAASPLEWRIDNLQSIGGHAVTTVGTPRVVQTDRGPAVEFDGAGDGLLINVNPLAGLERFTVHVTFKPAPDGGEEQRFVHFEEAQTENRALIELRLSNGRWALDTFLRS